MDSTSLLFATTTEHHTPWSVLVFIVVTLCGVAFYIYFSGIFSFLSSKKIIRIGVSKFIAEVGSASTAKACHGFILEALRCVIEPMGSSVELVSIDPTLFKKELKQGTVDLVVFDEISQIPKPKKVELLTLYEVQVRAFGLVFWEEIPEPLVSLQKWFARPDAITTVVKGSVAEQFCNKARFSVQTVVRVIELIIQLKIGITKAGLMRLEYARLLKREYPALKILPVSIPEPGVVQQEVLGLLSSNGHSRFFRKLKLAIQKAQEAGRFSGMYTKWFGPHLF